MELFRRLAASIAGLLGTPVAFMVALAVVVGWAISGPFFRFSDTWQLFINTGTTITTFLMVFLLQNTQNRDSRAIQLKLDEIIHKTQGPRNQLIDLENMTEAEFEAIAAEFSNLRRECSEGEER